MALLEVEGLKTYFFVRRGIVKAVDGVSFSIDRGQTMGLVGESGCGKSATALSLVRLVPSPGRSVEGSIRLDGVDLLRLSEQKMRLYRGRSISMILQDPLSSLNPVLKIGYQVGEGITIHDGTRGRPLRDSVLALLRAVGIAAAESRLREYPHQLSGGMRQRVVGAACLACHPQVLIADEPTTSLDVTIQLQYLNLLKTIQRRERLAMLFVTHDFGIVAKMCDSVAVMYAGRIVEKAEVHEVLDRPLHPYTKALMGSLPSVDEKVQRLKSIEGQPPGLLNLPARCAFSPRCNERGEECDRDECPPEVEVAPNHFVGCWRHG